MSGKFDFHVLRATISHCLLEGSRNFYRVLIRDQAHGHLGGCRGGDDRLGAMTLVAAGEAVDVASGAAPGSLERCVARFARKG